MFFRLKSRAHRKSGSSSWARIVLASISPVRVLRYASRMALALAPFALERWFAPREFVAKHHASSSDCEPLGLDALLAHTTPELRDAFHATKLGYTDMRGSDELRTAIAPLHGVGADDILCVTPSEGITLTMLALCKPGDLVVVAMPAYQSLFDVARAQGCTVLPWMPREDSECWRFDPDDLRRILDGASQRPKLVVVNFPHNPTGAYPTPDEWSEVISCCERTGSWLFSDEMYRSLELSPVAQVPSAAVAYERGIALGGLSKSFSAPGLRQGWLACRQRGLLGEIAALKDYTTICGNIVGEILSRMVLADRERIARENRQTIARSIAAVDAVIARSRDARIASSTAAAAISWRRPRAGSTALLRFDDESASASRISESIFQERCVLLLPSTVFNFGDRHARLGLGRAGFVTALAEVAAFVGGPTVA